MWNKPWKYREGFAISIGLLITGALLQVSIGAMEWLVFMWPANIIALTALVIVSGLFYALRSKVYLFRFMTQVEAAVPALATASVLTVIMGLSRQVADGHPAMDPVGLSRMLSFWPFVLIYLWSVVIVAEVGIHQLMHFQKRFIPSLVSHIGLFIFITCGTLGSADMQRLKMYCEEGKPEWRGIDNFQQVHELADCHRTAEVQYRRVSSQAGYIRHQVGQEPACRQAREHYCREGVHLGRTDGLEHYGREVH